MIAFICFLPKENTRLFNLMDSELHSLVKPPCPVICLSSGEVWALENNFCSIITMSWKSLPLQEVKY